MTNCYSKCIVFFMGVTLSAFSEATDLSDISICTEWPKLKCEGGDLYVTLDYWSYANGKENSNKIERHIKSTFFDVIDTWNKKSGLHYNIYWGVGGPGENDKKNSYRIYFQFRDLDAFVGKEGFVGSTSLYGFSNRESLSQGPLIVKRDDAYEKSLKRYIECHVVEEYYSDNFKQYLAENKVGIIDYCKYYFVGGR